MLAHSVTILDVDVPEMKMELLLRIQGNILEKSLSPVKRCLEKKKKTRTLFVEGGHPENDLSGFCEQDQIKE